MQVAVEIADAETERKVLQSCERLRCEFVRTRPKILITDEPNPKLLLDRLRLDPNLEIILCQTQGVQGLQSLENTHQGRFTVVDDAPARGEEDIHGILSDYFYTHQRFARC